MPETWPLLLEPDQLEARLGETNLLVVDLGRAEIYHQLHIPGAVFLDYPRITAMRPPVGGLLPDERQLSDTLSEIGLTPETHVVAYDDEGGGKAARLLWTLEAIGHHRYSLLDGGLHAWANERHPLSREPARPTRSDYRARILPDRPPVADADFVLRHLGDPSVVLLDARAPEEYSGERLFARRGGHIPGAVNLEWTEGMDRERNLRLKHAEELKRQLEALDITPDKTVVAYCQTHHRSALSWFMLKALGYPDVKGYEGSWSDWGNRPDTPIEN